MGERKKLEGKGGEEGGSTEIEQGAEEREGGEERDSRRMGIAQMLVAQCPLILSCKAPLSGAWVVWAGLSGSAQGQCEHSGALRQPAQTLPPIALPAQLETWVSGSVGGAGETCRIQPEIRGHSG